MSEPHPVAKSKSLDSRDTRYQTPDNRQIEHSSLFGTTTDDEIGGRGTLPPRALATKSVAEMKRVILPTKRRMGEDQFLPRKRTKTALSVTSPFSYHSFLGSEE